ncbi:MAG: NAD(P)H-binding protein [Chloroflexota bacterium]
MLLITGGTGYVGGYILEALEGKMPRSEIRVFSREGADIDKLRSLGYSVATGSVTNLDEVRRAMQGVDQVIHLVAIIRESRKKGQTFDTVMGLGTENVVQAAKEAGVKRFVYMSALGATNMSTGYFRNKMRGEEAVKASGIPYVIFRPSFLIGAGGEFTALLKQLTMLPIVPVIGPGNYPVQPVYVRDMARYFVQALEDDRYLNQTFEVGGPETFEYNEMMRRTLSAQRKKGFLFHAPLFLIRPTVPLVEAVAPKLLTKDQFTMLLEGSHTDDNRIHDLGGFALTPFSKAVKIALTTPPPDTYAKAKIKQASARA